MSLAVFPGASQLLLNRRSPFVVDLFDQELLLGLVHHLNLDIYSHIDEVVVLRINIGFVLSNRQSGMAVRGDDG